MSVELRPIGVACNLACHYCYQEPQRAAGNVRRPVDLARMKAAVLREGGSFTLFGGEPLLLAKDSLEELFRFGLETHGSNGIQTNAVLIDDDHLALFRRYRVAVGVSIDGPGELNDLRWHGTLQRTRQSTEASLASIARLCRELGPPGVIVTLHRLNASAERLPRLCEFLRELAALGVRSVRLHLLEAETAEIRLRYALSDEENAAALLCLAELESQLTGLRFDVLDEIERGLLGRDDGTACVWHACDPYTTAAVRGVEGDGASSNCGRTNKDGVDFPKADRAGFERYLALSRTPEEHGGCRGCRFFLVCKGQCPGTATEGDFRHRSEHCGVWKRLFTHVEERLVARGDVPLSLHPARPDWERRLARLWASGQNTTLQSLVTTGRGAAPAPAADAESPPDFPLPDFLRTAFVSELAQSTWQPRIEAVRSALARLAVTAARRISGVHVVRAAHGEVLALHDLAARAELHTLLLDDVPVARSQWLAIGQETAIAAYRDRSATGDLAALDELRDLPSCCRLARAELRRTDRAATPWDHAGGDGLASDGEVVLDGSPLLNPLLRAIGVDPLGYIPCSPRCAPSLARAEQTIALGRDTGEGEAMEWLEAMLRWPAEWSALHGIAEVKTGVLRFIAPTAYTAGRRSVRHPGSQLAAEAARGLRFPYASPPARRRLPLAPDHTARRRE
jgi:uncharacterized protein